MSDKIKFNSITPQIVHVVCRTKKELASTMIRFQEHYESPFEDIRGKIFTLGYLRSKGSRANPGVATYEGGHHFDADWSGYNFPGSALEPFIKGLFDPLTTEEQDIVNALKYRQDRYYVIGTYGEDDPAAALDHEICHALYYINDEYRSEVDAVLAQYDLSNLKKLLLEWGYCKDVLDDECHAYLSADYDWLFKKKEEVEKFEISIDKSIHTKLREIKHKYFKENKLD